MMMQAQKAHHVLERILFVVIACTLVFAGLCIYSCLVGIYEGCWPLRVVPSHSRAKGWSATSCIYHARWTPIEQSHLPPGQLKAFQSSCASSVGGDLETFVLLSDSSQDRHASGVMYFAAQPMGAAAAAASVIEVEIEVFYGSEEALRTETRTVCALRRSQGPSRGPLDIGVLVSKAAASAGSEYTARNDISLKITVWLPRRPRAEHVQVTFPAVTVAPAPESGLGRPQSHQRVIGDSPLPHGLDQASLRSMNAPIEAYSFNESPPLEPTTAPEPIAAGVSPYINNNDLPSIILSVTNTPIIRRSCPATKHESESGGSFRVNAHSLSEPLGIRFFGQTPGEALDLDISSASECHLGSVSLPCIWAPFELLATIIRPSDNEKFGMEEPTERSRNRCVNSRIVRHGACLVPDV